MDAFNTWMAMGGYSFYVWSAYALVMGVLGFNLWSMRRARKITHQHLKRWFKKLP